MGLVGGERWEACSRSLPCCPVLIYLCRVVWAPWESGVTTCLFLLAEEHRGREVKRERKRVGTGAAADPVNTGD